MLDCLYVFMQVLTTWSKSWASKFSKTWPISGDTWPVPNYEFNPRYHLWASSVLRIWRCQKQWFFRYRIYYK